MNVKNTRDIRCHTSHKHYKWTRKSGDPLLLRGWLMTQMRGVSRRIVTCSIRWSIHTCNFQSERLGFKISRLPEKSIVRSRCVSKLWSSITTDSYFINMFETRSPRPSLLLCISRDDNLFVASIPQHTHSLHQNSNKSYSSSQPIDRYHMEFPLEYNRFRPTESVHGLICFQSSGTAIVWNPSKREFLTLPKPRKSWSAITVLLGYDPIEGKHKVMCIPSKRSSHVCRVLTLGSAQESWRTVKTNHIHRTDLHICGRCIKGVIYYRAYIYHTRVWVIMSFDVRSETFDMIQFPSDIYRNVLINYRGRLACVVKKNGGRLWILDDAEKHNWSFQDFLSPIGHYDPSSRTYLSLKGFTHAGEFIFVSSSVFRLSSYILFWDPVRNSFRRFVLDGIVGNEYGLHNDVRTFALHAFPNHIDGQISM